MARPGASARAKTVSKLPATGRRESFVTAKKALGWLIVAFVVFFILSSPTEAGGVVQSAFDGMETAANQLAEFVKSLA
jgi:hypothetical protein